MTTDELLQAGNIERIADVEAPTPQVQKLAAAKCKALDGYGINGHLCYRNAQCLVDAMKDQGEEGWEVVYGLARNNQGALAWHVWAKHGDQHFDPTWSYLALPLEQCTYFALTARHPVKKYEELFELHDRVWKLNSQSE